MKMFETVVGDKTVVWAVGENGVKSIDADGHIAVVTLENEKFGEVEVRYNLDTLPFYATA